MDGLSGQIQTDPRIRAIVQERKAGRLSTAELRAMGFNVPDGYTFAFGGRSGYGNLLDDQQSWFESGWPAIAIGATAGGLGLAGMTGGTAGTAAASGNAAAAPSAGTLMGTGGFDGAIGTPAMSSAGAAGGAAPLGGYTAAAGGGASLGKQIADKVLTPQGIASLATAIPSLIANSGGVEDDPNVKALMEMALKRQQRADPLHESVVNLANAMLPTGYQRR